MDGCGISGAVIDPLPPVAHLVGVLEGLCALEILDKAPIILGHDVHFAVEDVVIVRRLARLGVLGQRHFGVELGGLRGGGSFFRRLLLRLGFRLRPADHFSPPVENNEKFRWVPAARGIVKSTAQRRLTRANSRSGRHNFPEKSDCPYGRSRKRNCKEGAGVAEKSPHARPLKRPAGRGRRRRGFIFRSRTCLPGLKR